MFLSSYAKINLSLRINAKRKEDGLHEIQSYFCLINLSDKIKLKKIKGKKDKIFFKGHFSKSVNKKNNSVINLLKFLRKLKQISSYYSITINKNIPVFGGLGGGTGNAAFIMKVLLKGKVSISLLNKAERIIGSDLRFFFYEQGFLRNLKTITHFQKKKLFFILIKPNIRCSTREIYSKVRNYSKKQLLVQNKINTKNKFINVLSQENNDLQSIVEKKYPLIKKLLIAIRNEKGCCFSRMTGSGSVCYGLFKDQITAKKALNKLKTKFPKFWISFAKTV